MRKKIVALVMGSSSDLPVVDECARILDEFKIGYQTLILSAHRSPEATRVFARNAMRKGFKVIIACAGGAAHLAGVIASHTTLPVIGVPVQTKALRGIDSYLSILQMPGGVPVATMAIGTAGAKNAAIFAAQILAITDKAIQGRLRDFKKDLALKVKKQSRAIKK